MRKCLSVLMVLYSISIYPQAANNNCSHGIRFYVNGINRCIDTTILYYPLYPFDFKEISEYTTYLKSLNMKILNEEKWYNEEKSDNQIRILFIEYPPSFDSVKLYTFLNIDSHIIKLVKKQMLVFTPKIEAFITKEKDTLNYFIQEYDIQAKEFRFFLNRIKKLERYDTFENYFYPGFMVTEFIINNNYKLIISNTPNDVDWKDKRSKRITSKIIKWLDQY